MPVSVKLQNGSASGSDLERIAGPKGGLVIYDTGNILVQEAYLKSRSHCAQEIEALFRQCVSEPAQRPYVVHTGVPADQREYSVKIVLDARRGEKQALLDFAAACEETMHRIDTPVFDFLVLQLVACDSTETARGSIIQKTFPLIDQLFGTNAIKALHVSGLTEAEILAISDWEKWPSAVHIATTTHPSETLRAFCSAANIQIIGTRDEFSGAIFDAIGLSWMSRYSVLAKGRSVLLANGFLFAKSEDVPFSQ